MWGATTVPAAAGVTVAISIHAPRVGRDSGRATRTRTKSDFNPRAPCGARPRCYHGILQSVYISIHAPRVGRDNCRFAHKISPFIFQSTRPVWGATMIAKISTLFFPISIHAPRVGRDKNGRIRRAEVLISIHAPRVGRDDCICVDVRVSLHFNPRAPCGARPRGCKKDVPRCAISIHAPRVGRDIPHRGWALHQTRFQSTRPVWGATANLTILPRQICTKGTKEFLLGRKTHGKKEK